ncbi:hypothetical protein JXA02_10615, partial [candidate division KSB1 bacterium]|nr:hypothetical protein [candidate division KSB1 bacterium]
MKQRTSVNRRQFLQGASLFGMALAAPSVLTSRTAAAKTSGGELIFKPHFVQKGVGPHLLEWAYASDENWDAFWSDISASADGVSISDTGGRKRFGIDVRWNVEGFGYIYITLDNGGEFYELPRGGAQTLNLNFEAARSRVLRNRRRAQSLQESGWAPSREVRALLDLAEELYDDAHGRRDEDVRSRLSQQALLYAMWAGEKIELEKAWFDIKRAGYRPNFFMGCDARGFYQMDQDIFLERFT